MADSSKLRVTELDFDQIKSNLKTYLQSQAEFTDYDFEGSALAVLLDTLSYNTHYNAIYANLVANEMFLDSASKRSSVVSLAKHFGYTSRSTISPRAKVNLTVTTTGAPQSLMLPKYTTFTTSIDGVDYTFYNLANITTIPSSTNVFNFTDVEIVEGTPLVYSYTVQAGQSKFMIPNANVDTSTLTVEVQNSGTDATRTTFKLAGAGDFTTVSGTDPVYFLEETRDGFYQLVFGDGNIGKKVIDGNIVQITYLMSHGTAANNATTFTLGAISTFTVTNFSMTLAEKANGGRDQESVDSIRYNASKFFVTQNRAVTAEDYKNIIIKENPDIDAVSAWGGDTATPPVYGKVFICAKPKNGVVLTDDAKNKLTTILGRKNVVGITPEFVDPEYLYLMIAANFYFDPSKTNTQKSTLEANVLATIQQFKETELNNFDSIFRKSRLSRQIDYTDKSILNNNLIVSMYKFLNVNSESNLNYTINFMNPIERIRSTEFRLSNDSTVYYLDDDGDGNIRRFHINHTQKVIDSPAFGVVDYASGRILLPSVAFSMLTNNCKIIADPVTPDVIAVQNQIITLVDADTSVTGIVDTRKPLVK